MLMDLGTWPSPKMKSFPMKRVAALIFPLMVRVLFSQNIVQLEYFMDTDPGFGQGTQVTITPDSLIDLTFHVDLSSVADGFHYLFTRTKYAGGQWSHTYFRPFLKTTMDTTTIVTIIPNIVQLEYFIDTDSGYGQGTQVTLTADTLIDLTFNADLSSITDGFHYLVTRTKDADGRWSNSYIRPFFKKTINFDPPTAPENIVSIHYGIFTEEGVVLSGVYSGFPDTTDLDLEFNIDVTALDADSTYQLQVYVEDEGSNRSFDQRITVLVNNPPQAVDDTVVTLEDSTIVIEVIANDVNEGGDELTVFWVSDGHNGSSSVGEGNTIVYTPNANYFGSDSLIYRVRDQYSQEDSAQIWITILSINDQPAAFALVSPGHDSTLVITSANLGDTLTFAWEGAVDVDGDIVRYGAQFTNGLGALYTLGDTTATEVRLPHAAVVAIMEGLGQLTITGTWDIFAADGEDTTWASNGPFTFTIDATTLDVLRQALLPQQFALHQNYPNPFNPSTTIRFDLPATTDVHLAVYDLLGREVVRLVDGQLEAGYHQRVWNGRDRDGREVPTGLYFVLVVTPEFRKSIKVVLLK